MWAVLGYLGAFAGDLVSHSGHLWAAVLSRDQVAEWPRLGRETHLDYNDYDNCSNYGV